MPGYFLALPGVIEPSVAAALFVGTFLTSSSAQTMNQMIEVDRDARMKRTAMRPLPSGQLTSNEAARFAATAGAVGLATLGIGTTGSTAAVAATTMVTYAAVYTPLKVRSPYNTHVGAISGSLPTLMGFTAALSTGLCVSPWLPHAAWLFGMQTLWQMPHFYSLAWLHRSDYLKGGYTMFPLSDATGTETAAMSKPYLVALCILPWAMSASGSASWMLPAQFPAAS
ncbi:COX10 [Symbiodinium natans]|uniref:Heme O synthase n=1 Tax=Symbiodinium natans TaxID=878477 RepID=A0A812LYQ5_9DINO|nr:COX10 [Symbiodinium natans]